MFNFDKKINRRGSNSIKWDGNGERFGKEDVIPMWIADMDFEISPYIQEEFQKILDRKVFGYQSTSEEYFKAIENWMLRRHGYKIEKDWICFSPNVVAGLAFAVNSVTEEGDEVIIHSPVYGPFYHVIENTGRKVVECPLNNEDGYYTMDFEKFEKSITPKTKATIICNPHNPCGRVWTRDELKTLADICLKHNLYIISDDIHSEIVYSGHKHTFISTISEEVADRTITCTSPAKAFNLASIQVANCIIKNPDIRKKYTEQMNALHIMENAFVEAAITGAYNKSEQWLDELVEYLEGNVDLFVNYIRKEIPKLKVSKPEGTYLVWVDFSSLGMTEKELSHFLVHKCNLAVNPGSFFGESNGTHCRFNLACNRGQIIEVLNKMKEEIN